MAENEFEKNSLRSLEQSPVKVSSSVNPAHIRVNGISGPLVIFFGPRNIGKTVALLRLSTYLSKYKIEVDENFRSDTENYSIDIEGFNKLRRDSFIAPSSTGVVNFLLLNVTYNSEKICQILEAPGEHFFKSDDSEDLPFEPYLSQIFNANYRKVYIFCFSINMFKNDNDRQAYGKKVSNFISDRVDPKRDRIIILCTKCNEEPTYIRNSKPLRDKYQQELYKKPGFNSIKETIKNSGFKYVPFVPFSSGDFVDGGKDFGKIFTMSPDFYPEKLWAEINNALTGKSGFKWWPFN
jgi:hypothetical protein